jgi:hypothetical protein
MPSKAPTFNRLGGARGERSEQRLCRSGWTAIRRAGRSS